VQAALGGLSYGVNGRPVNGSNVPYLQSTLFNSPKAGPAVGGRISSEPATPTAGGASTPTGRPGGITPQRGGGVAAALGSPKIGGGGYGSAATPPRRLNSGTSLNATAPAGSLAGITRMAESAARGGAPSPSGIGLGGLGALGATGRGGPGLSSTMPAGGLGGTGSRPPTAGQAAMMSTMPAGVRPGSTGLGLARPASSVPGLMYSVGRYGGAMWARACLPAGLPRAHVIWGRVVEES
jgi:hypothetical protein